jgi:hypothetical protein
MVIKNIGWKPMPLSVAFDVRQYHDLLRLVLETGMERSDRTWNLDVVGLWRAGAIRST